MPIILLGTLFDLAARSPKRHAEVGGCFVSGANVSGQDNNKDLGDHAWGI
jgi:hypothetical protein